MKQEDRYMVSALLVAKPEKEQELKNELSAVAVHSRKEEKNIEYHLYQDRINPAQFMLHEVWTSKEDHEKQFQKPYIIAFAQKLDGLLAQPFQAFSPEEI